MILKVKDYMNQGFKMKTAIQKLKDEHADMIE